mgnify:CR=1 FL=1
MIGMIQKSWFTLFFTNLKIGWRKTALSQRKIPLLRLRERACLRIADLQRYIATMKMHDKIIP